MGNAWHEAVEVAVDEMARAAPANSEQTRLVAAYVGRLRSAKLDQQAFDSTVSELMTDNVLRVADVVDLATRYRGGGVVPRSKKAALEVIRSRFLELVRDRNKFTQATKSRPW